MNPLSHASAKPSHYNKQAENYDAFNEKSSQATNQVIEKILKKHGVKTVLDFACGTGSQVFFLAKRGYEVVGSDINSNMLKIARHKEKEEKLGVKLLKGDMRTTTLGKFDAVLTIFNAVGHLTKLDFEKAMGNIHKNLKKGGLFVFDVFNLTYLKKGDNIKNLTIDWLSIMGTTKIRQIQYSTIDDTGVLASYTTNHVQEKSGKPRISRETQTLQVYTAQQLKEMLQRNGFKVLKQCGIDGSKLSETKTERILTIAQKC